MVTLRMIANAGRKWGPITRLADTLEHMRSILGRLWRAAPGALSVVAFCALFGVAASAQQNPQPQSEPAPPAAAAPSTPPASVSAAAASWQQSLVALFGVAPQPANPHPIEPAPQLRGTLNAPGIRICGGCELAAIVGSAPLTPSSAAGARRRGCGQPRLQHRSAWQRREQPDRQEFRVGRSRCRGARPAQARRAASATASRDRRERTLVCRPDPLRGWVRALR